jgi:hypothetical protein
MSFSRVGPNQTIERGQFRLAKSGSPSFGPGHKESRSQSQITSRILFLSFVFWGEKLQSQLRQYARGVQSDQTPDGGTDSA